MTTAPGIDPDRERPSPFPASDSAADIAAKVAEMQAFFDVSQQTARQAVAGAQLPELIGYGLDVMTGELELELRDTAGARATVAAVRDHLQAQLGYPVRLRWHPAAPHLQSR
ncbi:TPA: hypothetical protein ACXI73_002854 [Stenotrophomonas maltophilia]